MGGVDVCRCGKVPVAEDGLHGSRFHFCLYHRGCCSAAQRVRGDLPLFGRLTRVDAADLHEGPKTVLNRVDISLASGGGWQQQLLSQRLCAFS